MTGDGLLGETLGRYRIESVIGQGGFATVYRAVDTVLERPVALKALGAAALRDPTNGRRFLREGRALANMDHPAIVPVYDAGDEDGTPWMAMRLVEGGALDQHLAQGRRFKPEETVALVRRIASALDHAHGQELVHRDVKPSNILLEDGRANGAWLTDFGIAVTARSMGMYTTGALGTAAYMAPEQARPNQAGPSADLYSLACVAYELLIGDRPYPGRDYVALLMAHANEPVPQTGYPEIDAFMAQALAKNVEDRPSSGKELVRKLTDALDASSAVAPPAGSARGAGTEAGAGAGAGTAAAAGAGAAGAIAAGAGAAAARTAGVDAAPSGTAHPAADEAPTAAEGREPTLVHPAPPEPPAPPPPSAPVGAPRQSQPVAAGHAAPAYPHGQYPSGWGQPAPTRGKPGAAGAQPGAHRHRPVGQGPSGQPAAPAETARRASLSSLLVGLVALVVALGAGLAVYFVETDDGGTRRLRDSGGARYEFPASWTAPGPDHQGPVELSQEGTVVVTIRHYELSDSGAADYLAQEGDCSADAEPAPGFGGADSTARCEMADGGLAYGATAFGRFWLFEFTSGLDDSERQTFLSSLEFFDPEAEADEAAHPHSVL